MSYLREKGNSKTNFEITTEIEAILSQNGYHDLSSMIDNAVASSHALVKDIINKLSWQETELLVAGVLRAYGYYTTMTSKGPDMGRDIIASRDPMGLQRPILKVEVKKRTKSKIGAPEIKSFMSCLQSYNQGIYVSTTGFSKMAEFEVEHAPVLITLVDMDMLIRFILLKYEELDIETKSLVPLKRLYLPVEIFDQIKELLHKIQEQK